MLVQDLGALNYRDTWATQEEAHAEILAGGEERIFLVEHPPVITYGRRPGGDRNLLASTEQLASLGVEVVQSDRGGDITFHGPGQIVVYPIIRLNDHKLSVSGYVHALEDAVLDTLAEFNVHGQKDCGAIGVWVRDENDELSKVCAIGVRIRRGVTLHGLALNVSTDLSFFNLIVPCGMQNRPVTSMTALLGERAPTTDAVKLVLIQKLNQRINSPSSCPPPRPAVTMR